MPPYLNQPGQKVRALQPGTPEYLLGSWNQDVATTKMWVSKVALASDVATLTVQVTRGPIPAVGSMITVTGTQTGGGEFNVTRVALTAVTIDAGTGAGTVSFALSHSDVAAVTDGGTATVDTPEIADALVAGSSCPAWLAQELAGRTLGALVNFPSKPTAATVNLQYAIHDIDHEYQDVDVVSSVAGGTVTAGTLRFPTAAPGFYRFNVSALTAGGGSPTIAAKLLV